MAALLLLQIGCRTATTPVESRLDALFADLHARGLFDGAVVVSSGGKVVYERGFGYADVERGVPFTADTPADGGSLAKTFTAALLLALQHEGVLALDDPAQKYLPELPYGEITLRHLLSHSSGIPVGDYDYFDAHLPREQVRTTETLLRVIAEQKPPLASAPGTHFQYSSFAFDLAALAASRAAGKSYGELLSERFFRPLAITSAFLRPGRFGEFPGVRTRGYQRVGGKLEPNEVFDYEAFHGGSNIYFSARDLDRWNVAAVLSPAALADALRPATIAGAPSGLTLGSWYRSGDAFWYSGHLQGFHSELFRDARSGLSVVYISNNTIEPWLQKAIVRAAADITRGRSVAPLAAPALRELTKEQRANLAGRWRLPGGEERVITTASGRPSVVYDRVTYGIVQISPSTFYVPGLDWIIGFGGEGASRMYVGTNVEEAWATRVPEQGTR